MTTTVSCSWPTSSVIFLTEDATPSVTLTSGNWIVLNPIRETVTVYCPGARAGIRKLPVASVIDCETAPVALCFAVTSTPGITAPDVSATVPDRLPADAPP